MAASFVLTENILRYDMWSATKDSMTKSKSNSSRMPQQHTSQAAGAGPASAAWIHIRQNARFAMAP